MSITATISGKQTTIWGSFSKAVAGSVSFNVAPSGIDSTHGGFCSTTCLLLKLEICYAIQLEKVHTAIAKSGTWKAAHFSEVLRAAHASVGKVTNAPWVRFAAFGAFPAQLTVGDCVIMASMAERLDHTRVHFPVETRAKYTLYESLGFYPRLSLQNKSDDSVRRALKDGYRVSISRGPISGRGRKALAKAETRETIKEYRAKGISAKACPAIMGRAKCGQCTLCNGINGPQLIGYPMH